MGYRTCDRPPAKPEDFLPVFDMHNNEVRTWTIPCFYFDQEKPIDWHDYKMHDYLGWPNPNKPGHICQELPDYGSNTFSPWSVWTYIDMNKAIPIHLLSDYENYVRGCTIAFDPYDENGDEVDTSDITAAAAVRSAQDWLVDIRIEPQIDHFAGKPKEYLFNVYLNENPETSEHPRKDLLVRGKLVVLPG